MREGPSVACEPCLGGAYRNCPCCGGPQDVACYTCRTDLDEDNCPPWVWETTSPPRHRATDEDPRPQPPECWECLGFVRCLPCGYWMDPLLEVPHADEGCPNCLALPRRDGECSSGICDRPATREVIRRPGEVLARTCLPCALEVARAYNISQRGMRHVWVRVRPIEEEVVP